MVFSEIPVGQNFCFGRNMVASYGYNNGARRMREIPLVWKKTALNGLSVCVEEYPYASFDHARAATGTNQSIRLHGHRVFFLSSLYKYLNCEDTSWMEVENGDSTPSVRGTETNRGFLSTFTDEERVYMETFSMTVPNPPGYTKQYGASQTKNVLVGIPSLEQLGDSRSAGTFGVIFNGANTWVTDADTMHKHYSYNSAYRIGGERIRNVMPVIKIKDDAPVDRDEHGRYVIRIPETDFAGDLSAFLGFELVA